MNTDYHEHSFDPTFFQMKSLANLKSKFIYL